MKYEVTKINPWSLARITSLLGVALSIVLSLPYIIFGLILSGGLSFSNTNGGLVGGGLVIGGLVGGIILSYVVGLIAGFVIAYVYNWIADLQKGIEINIDLVEEQEEK